jgi:hypothetical protein
MQEIESIVGLNKKKWRVYPIDAINPTMAKSLKAPGHHQKLDKPLVHPSLAA